MSKPTELDIENAKMYIEENELTLGEFIQDLYEMDPADYRKYWGHMDPKELREVLEAEDPTESEPMTDAKWAEITEKSHNDAIAFVQTQQLSRSAAKLAKEFASSPEIQNAYAGTPAEIESAVGNLLSQYPEFFGERQMNVEDLIAELSKFPYDTPVRMQRDEFNPKGNSAPEVGLGHDNAVWLS